MVGSGTRYAWARSSRASRRAGLDVRRPWRRATAGDGRVVPLPGLMCGGHGGGVSAGDGRGGAAPGLDVRRPGRGQRLPTVALCHSRARFAAAGRGHRLPTVTATPLARQARTDSMCSEDQRPRPHHLRCGAATKAAAGARPTLMQTRPSRPGSSGARRQGRDAAAVGAARHAAIGRVPR